MPRGPRHCVSPWWILGGTETRAHRSSHRRTLQPRKAHRWWGKSKSVGGGGECSSHPGSLQTLSAGPVLGPVMTRPLYVGHKAVRLSLLVISFGGARLIRLTRLLLLLLLGIYTIEGHLLGQCVLVGNGQIS
jgi:hypothetical protein